MGNVVNDFMNDRIFRKVLGDFSQGNVLAEVAHVMVFDDLSLGCNQSLGVIHSKISSNNKAL